VITPVNVSNAGNANLGIATLVVVFFWVKTVALYIATALFGLLLSLIASYCVVRGLAAPDENSFLLGLWWSFLSVGVSSLLVPICLGFTAELVQDKVLGCRFNWVRGLQRVLLALPMGVGPVYAWWVLIHREDARSAHWLAELVLLGCVSAVFAYLALRVRRQLAKPPTVVGRS
jgi:hypothetical protein